MISFDCFYLITKPTTVLSSRLCSHSSTLNLLSIIVYPYSSSDSIFPWANKHRPAYLSFFYSFVRCKIRCWKNAENPDLKTIFARNNNQNSDKAITKIRNCKFDCFYVITKQTTVLSSRLCSHASTLNLLSIIVYPHSSSDSIFPWANKDQSWIIIFLLFICTM